jgi:aryl-alcohol dehydrogenase-like predicted oxidoreductase
MLFGSVTDETTSFAILDRYVAAGGTFIDTSDNVRSGSMARRAGRARNCSGAGGAAAALPMRW